MSPESKELLDYLIAFLGPSAAGGIVLAVFGYLKARAEKPHIAEKPSVGSAALAQIGGMVMGQSDLREMIEAMRGISASYDRCSLLREAEMQWQKQLARERHDHEAKIADVRHEDWRVMSDLLRTLNDRLRDMRPT